jgi:site-specific DNA recombinase
MISFNAEDDEAEVNLQASIAEKEALLQKHRKALDLVNDAYELGDYTRKEWLLRKEKWQKSIDLVKNEIFDLKKKYRSQHKRTDEER